MVNTYWHKQTAAKPLFEELVWSQPQNRRSAGKLLIVGGNAHGFAAPAEAYAEATKAGVGTARVLLPDAIAKLVGGFIESGYFAPSTPSGSFAKTAEADLIEQAGWADGVLLAGDLGRNSETAVLLEKFAGEYNGQLTLTKGAVDYFKLSPKVILDRPNTTLVVTIADIQKLAANASFDKAFTFNMELMQLVETLYEFTKQFRANIILKHSKVVLAAAEGQVSTTQLAEDVEIWRIKTATRVAIWWLQNPAKPFESLTTAIYNLFD